MRSHSKKFLFLVEPLHKSLSFFSAPHLFFIQLFIEKEKDILIAVFVHVSSSLVIAATIPILLTKRRIKKLVATLLRLVFFCFSPIFSWQRK